VAVFALIGGLMSVALPAHAAEAEIRAATIEASDEQYVLNADISAELTPFWRMWSAVVCPCFCHRVRTQLASLVLV
jgi:hypothetical protein